MGLWRRQATAAPCAPVPLPSVVLPELLAQCATLRAQTQALLREVIALTLQLAHTEAALSRVVEKATLSPEEFTYAYRQREE